jgi:hypothetical protein
MGVAKIVCEDGAQTVAVCGHCGQHAFVIRSTQCFEGFQIRGAECAKG